MFSFQALVHEPLTKNVCWIIEELEEVLSYNIGVINQDWLPPLPLLGVILRLAVIPLLVAISDDGARVAAAERLFSAISLSKSKA